VAVKDVIGSYFSLDDRISKTKNRIRNSRINFYNRSLTTRLGMIDDQLTTVGCDIETEVTNHVSATQIAEQHIRVLRLKKHYFNAFWNMLDTSSKEYYIDRYKHDMDVSNNELDELILDEVKEIEQAIRYQKKHYEGEEPTNKEKKDYETMLELLEA